MDLISECITRIKNSYRVKQKQVKVPASGIVLDIIKILKNKNLILDFQKKKQDSKNWILVKLKYTKNEPALSEFKQVSKPGRRIYLAKNKIPRILGGIGLAIISTSQGVMDDQTARQKGVGGEYICKAW